MILLFLFAYLAVGYGCGLASTWYRCRYGTWDTPPAVLMLVLWPILVPCGLVVLAVDWGDRLHFDPEAHFERVVERLTRRKS